MKSLVLIVLGIGMAMLVIGNSHLSFAQDVINGTDMRTYVLPDNPLKQLREGVALKDVKCNDGFQLIFKAEDGSPACIKQDSISKLILRGWMSTTPSLNQNNVISDYFYQGIGSNTGIVSIKNQTYYMMTATNTTYPIDLGMTVQFHKVTFSFPYGSLATPGGEIIPFDMTFPDGTTEVYGKIVKNPDGSGSMSGIGLGPGPSSNRTITVLSDHMHPRAGVTMTEDRIKLLVSTDVNTTGTQIQTSQNTTLPASFEPCDTPYSQNYTGIPALYIPANSTGKLCVRYHNLNDSPVLIGIRISEVNLTNDATDITTWNDSGNNTIPKGNSTVVYWIKTGDHKGLYGLTVFCVPMPLAVGSDNTTLTQNDFPWLAQSTWYCPEELYDFHIDSTTGIGVKYIPVK